MSELRLYAMTCGWLTAPTALFLAGEKGRLRISVPCYLIDHPQGRVPFDPRHYDLGHELEMIDGEHDLFGDGSVVCIPTHGHSPGHQSLRVRLPGGDVVLSADACYLRQTLERSQLPGGVIHDREQMLASLEKLRKLQRAGARIFYGHDPEFWAGVPQAPVEVR